VAGMMYPPFMLRIDGLNGSIQNSKKPDGTIAFTYWKISVKLTADPKTFMRKYLNSGILARFGDEKSAPVPIWTASKGGTIKYGSREEMYNYNSDTMEQISEPMFLTSVGQINGLSGGVLSDGKNPPTYIEGMIEEPFDFMMVGFPTTRV
jgi:hypothetical protein